VHLAHPQAMPGVPGLPECLAAAAALIAVFGYLAAAARLRRRGDAWPRRRDGSFACGVAAAAIVAPASPPTGPFTAHMIQHLIVGMIAPVLLVLGMPLTLALRALPVGGGRRALLAIVRSRPATVLVCPPVAAVLDAGGLWVLYRTPLFAATHRHPGWHALVHLHILVAGVVFTMAICQLGPLRRRYSLTARAATLVAAGAAHAVLAKTMWVTPPPGTGFQAGDVHSAAELMYYGGDAVEIALAAILALRWYAAGGRVARRATPACDPS
jgi:putative membrane protein